MTEIEWQQELPLRAEIYTAHGYEVRRIYEGGTGRKLWQATNPNGGKAILSTKEAAMGICKAGIKARSEKAMRESGELEELKVKGRAQIETMKELMK